MDAANNASPQQTWTVDVLVLPKEGVNDPEGEAIRGGLSSLGYAGVQSVRAGKLYRLLIAAKDRNHARQEAERMSNQLLANPVIQSYTIQTITVAGEVK